MAQTEIIHDPHNCCIAHFMTWDYVFYVLSFTGVWVILEGFV